MVVHEKDLYEEVINSTNTQRSDIINSFIFNYLSCSGFKDVNVLFSGYLGVFSKSVLLGKLSVDEYDNIDFVGALKYIEITHKSIRKDVLKLMVERILHFYMFYRRICNISPLNNDIFNNLGTRLGVVLSEKHGDMCISDGCEDFSSMVRILVGDLHDVLSDILCGVNECLEDNGVPSNMRNFDVKTIIGCFEDVFMSIGMSGTSSVGGHDIESKYNCLDLLSYDNNNKKRKFETQAKRLQSSTITKLSFCKKLSLGGRILDLKHSVGMSQSRVCCVIQKEGCCVVELYNTYIDDIFESQKVYSDMIDDKVLSVCFHREYMGYIYIAKGDTICCSRDNTRLHTPGVIYTSISQLYENVFMVGCSDGFVVLYDAYSNFLPKIRLSNEPIVSIDGSITKKYAVDKHGVIFALMVGRDDKMSHNHTPEISTSIVTSHAYSVFGVKHPDVCVNPQNDNVVLLRIDNNVYLLELSLSTGVYKFKEMARCSYNKAVVSVCFAQTGDHLIVLFEDGELVSSHIENLHDSKLLVTLDETPTCMCTGYSDSSSAADYYILVGTRSGSLLRYDVE